MSYQLQGKAEDSKSNQQSGGAIQLLPDPPDAPAEQHDTL